eukprot:1155337-Pelagomonas_calceolata.AAC.3
MSAACVSGFRGPFWAGETPWRERETLQPPLPPPQGHKRVKTISNGTKLVWDCVPLVRLGAQKERTTPGERKHASCEDMFFMEVSTTSATAAHLRYQRLSSSKKGKGISCRGNKKKEEKIARQLTDASVMNAQAEAKSRDTPQERAMR